MLDDVEILNIVKTIVNYFRWPQSDKT
jgi:hypothetical protein